MTFVTLTLLLLEVATGAVQSQYAYIGRSFDISELNLMAWDDWIDQPKQAVLTSIPDKCFVKDSQAASQQVSVTTYKTTTDFATNYALKASGSLGASVAEYSAKATISHELQTSSSVQKTKSSGIFVDANLLAKYTLDNTCFTSRPIFEPSMLSLFESLPVAIEDPSNNDDWRQYRGFIDAYGSHFVSSVRTGAVFTVVTIADSETQSSSQDVKNAGCLAASAYKVEAQGCVSTGTDSSEGSALKHTSAKSRAYGGDVRLRATLAGGTASSDDLNTFLASATDSDIAQLDFTTIWDSLDLLYGLQDQDNKKRVQNMKNYYNIYLSEYLEQPVPPGDCFEAHIDYKGNDIKLHIPCQDTLTCQQYCQENPQCEYFTFKEFDKLCDLKTSSNGRRGLRDDTSGPKSCGTKPDEGYRLVPSTGNGYDVVPCYYPAATRADCSRCSPLGFSYSTQTMTDWKNCAIVAWCDKVSFDVCADSGIFFDDYHPGFSLAATDLITVSDGRRLRHGK